MRGGRDGCSGGGETGKARGSDVGMTNKEEYLKAMDRVYAKIVQATIVGE